MAVQLDVANLEKRFTMHLQGGLSIAAVAPISFSVRAGECVVLTGPSGAGKSSILRMVYGNYGADGGSIRIATPEGPVDIVEADPRAILRLRRETVGHVSQFLRVLPRISTHVLVAEPLVAAGLPRDTALERAGAMLRRLNIPCRLWDVPPATFSGGEQQRVNIARGFLAHRPLLLLDEPSASLDAENRAVVIGLIREKKAAGVAILGIFHDEEVRRAVADRTIGVAATRAPDFHPIP